MNADEAALRSTFAAADLALPAPAGTPVTLVQLQARSRRRQVWQAALLLLGLGCGGSALAWWRLPSPCGGSAPALAVALPTWDALPTWVEWRERLIQLELRCRELAAASAATDEVLAASACTAVRAKAIAEHVALVCAEVRTEAAEPNSVRGTPR